MNCETIPELQKQACCKSITRIDRASRVRIQISGTKLITPTMSFTCAGLVSSTTLFVVLYGYILHRIVVKVKLCLEMNVK